jgi:hypothetical protein
VPPSYTPVGTPKTCGFFKVLGKFSKLLGIWKMPPKV